MAVFRHVATHVVGDATYLTGIADLHVVLVRGVPRLYATTRTGGGLSVFDVTGNQAVLMGQETYLSQVRHLTSPQLGVFTTSGGPILMPIGFRQDVSGAYRINADGSLGERYTMVAGHRLPADIVALTEVTVGGRTFVYLIEKGQTAPQTYEMTGPRAITHISGASVPGPMVDAMIPAMIGGQQYLLTVSALGDTITSYRLSADGSVVQTGRIGMDSGTGFASPTAISTVTLHGATYVIVAGTGSSSLSVLRLLPGGGMVPVDHVIDTLDTRFQSVTALETFTIGERVFVLAGGADDGISLFTLLPDGRLIHLTSLADTTSTTLAKVGAIAATYHNGRVQVFVSSLTEVGITQFELDLGTLGVSQYGGAGTLHGAAGNDLLAASADTVELRGGAGDDILVSGSGALRMWGGAGRDLFVLTPGPRTLWIMDYQPGIDRIDMSAFPMLRNVGQLTIQTTAQGARITYGATTIEITSATGDPIPASHFTNQVLLNLSRYPPFATQSMIVGTLGHDLLEGTNDDEVFMGDAGNDTIHGGGGNDEVYGGDGDDTLHGEDGNDVLYGTADSDWLYGGLGDDRLYGGDGNDTIYGGAGVDVLSGGAGADVFVFTSAAEIGIGATRDRITDFERGIDKIDLSAFGLRWGGPAWTFSGRGPELIFNVAHGSGRLIGDVNGDGVADFVIALDGIEHFDRGDLIL